MRYENVCLEGLAYTLPPEVVSSAEIEARLAPLYTRLKLPEGRLQLMTGIVERRLWPAGVLPGEMSALTAAKALAATGVPKDAVGLVVHGSVCRDFLEPATACGVHRHLGLSNACLVYDVSNACLGLLNGMLQAANMIELGQIEAAVVVGAESSRSLLENTIEHLNANLTLTRDSVKSTLASLTLGSGSAAAVLVHRRRSRTGNMLLGGVYRANSQHAGLCQSTRDETIGGGAGPLMQTDSEALLRYGVETARAAFADFRREVGWTTADIRRAFCHQVGRMHHRALFDALGLSPAIDYSTLEWLGNTGAVAVPLTAALGVENHQVRPRDKVALLGIGSGINVIMLAVEWGPGPVGR